MIFDIKVEEEFNKDNFCYKINKGILPEISNEIYGFNDKLNTHRNKIDKINCDIWKKIRWYINKYDFIVKDPIINRAFYKYWEIINVFKIFEEYNSEDNIFHCAEAPGGFIQGSNTYLNLNFTKKVIKNEDIIDSDGFTKVKKYVKQKKEYKIYTISLNKDLPKYKTYNLPSYNKKIMNKNVYITYGNDNTGDINNLDNIKYIKNLITDSYLITADGGFDEGTDFNNKEQLHYFLILNEIYSAICLQKTNGHFILKVFDIFTSTSINLLYLLNLCYNNIYIYKPKTSRPTNSEKYIICKNFNLNELNRNTILITLKELSENLKICNNKYNSFTLFKEIPKSFIENIKYMNESLLNKQCEHLEIAINLCENTEFINKYEYELHKSYDTRNSVFKNWQKDYNINLHQG